MAVKLWNVHFMRICVANLLLFVSLYMLFPVLPVEMSDRLGVPVAQTGILFLFFTAGMFLAGPFHAYLVDAYKRKYVCMFAFAVMLAATAGYAFVTNLTELILLSTVQGAGFGVAATAGITLAIDITNSTLRSAGNVSFSRMSRLGMILGIMLGAWLYQHYAFRTLLTVSVIAGAAGILTVAGVYVPFRAPIVTKLYSFDRFLLLRGWVPAINIVMITFLGGLFIPLVHPFLNEIFIGAIPLPFFAGVGVGYLVAFLFSHLFLLRPLSLLKERTMRIGILGIALEMLAMSLFGLHSPVSIIAILLGWGLGMLMPEFLVMFVKLSHHCQRGTANTTHLLATETGIALGIVTACCLDTDIDRMIHIAQIVAPVTLLFFLFFTYPYYKNKKVR